MTIADGLVLAAAGSYVVGYLIINQLVLRLFVMAGTLFYIAYYTVVADTPLWTAIWTSVALLIANLFGLWFLLAARTRLFLRSELIHLYDSIDDFKALPPGDFRRIIDAGRRRILTEDQVITREGASNDKLYFLLSGTAAAEKRNHRFDLPAGIFVGEAAYMLGSDSSATVTVHKGAEVLVWEYETLLRKSRRPRFKLALEAMISRDLSRKVAAAVSPDSLYTQTVVSPKARQQP